MGQRPDFSPFAIYWANVAFLRWKMDFSTKTINSLKAAKRGNLGWVCFFGKKIIVKNLVHVMLEMQMWVELNMSVLLKWREVTWFSRWKNCLKNNHYCCPKCLLLQPFWLHLWKMWYKNCLPKWKFINNQGAKKVIITACHLGQLKLAFTSSNFVSTGPPNFLMIFASYLVRIGRLLWLAFLYIWHFEISYPWTDCLLWHLSCLFQTFLIAHFFYK